MKTGAVVVFVALVCVAIYLHDWNRDSIGFRASALLAALATVVAFFSWFLFRGPQKPTLIIDADTIATMPGSQYEIKLSRDEITGMSEGPKGILLRTNNPYRRMLISRQLVGYAQCRQELLAWGVLRATDDVPGVIVFSRSVVAVWLLAFLAMAAAFVLPRGAATIASLIAIGLAVTGALLQRPLSRALRRPNTSKTGWSIALMTWLMALHVFRLWFR
jgi:hypothetical protein